MLLPVFKPHCPTFSKMSFKQSAVAATLFAGLLQGSQAQLFTVNCAPLTIQRGDPIVFPGVISPHVHIVTGGTAFQQTEPNDVARNAKATTCDKLLDKSNYWQPQLYHQRHDGKFELVKMQGNVSAHTNVLILPGALSLYISSQQKTYLA